MTRVVPLECDVDGVRLRWYGGRHADVIMPTSRRPEPHVVCSLSVGDPQAPQALEHPGPMLRRCLLLWMREHYAHAWRSA